MTATPMNDKLAWTRRGLLCLGGIGMLVAAGCGSSGSGNQAGGGGGSGGNTGSGSATTVQASTVSGMANVLSDSSGKTLYVSDQETSGKILCSSSACTAIWTPLTVPAGAKATGPAQMSATLGTLKRPDGKTQVTLNGAPMYTFSFDHGAGKNDGNGEKDSFDGTDFTWHTATTAGAAGTAPSMPASSASSTSGGYTY